MVEPVVSSPSAYSKGRRSPEGTQQRKNLTCALVLWAMPCLQNLSYFTRSRNRIATSTSAAATGTSLIDLVHPPILLISRAEERGLLHLCAPCSNTYSYLIASFEPCSIEIQVPLFGRVSGFASPLSKFGLSHYLID